MGHILSRQLVPTLSTTSAQSTSTPASVPNPILFKRPHIVQEINQRHLEEKAKRLLSQHKKQEKEARAKRGMSETDWDLNEERRLRKVATRGVVKLFNAIKTAQKAIVVEDKKRGQKRTRGRQDEGAVLEPASQGSSFKCCSFCSFC
jgi:hypothetical protein